MRSSLMLPAALAGLTTARIVGVAAPNQLAPGEDFELTLITENYIQSVLDVSAAVGLSNVVFPDTLGFYVGSFYIGQDQSNILTNITHTLTVPSSYPLEQTNLETAVTSLYGASSSPTTILWSLAVTITNGTTGTNLISTLDGANACTATLPTSSSAASSSGPASTSSSPSTPTTTPRAPPAAGDLTALITTLQTGLQNLANTIVQSNTPAGQQEYSRLSPLFDRFFFLATGPDPGPCPTPPAGKALTQTEALQIIQGIQSGLNEVSLDVTVGDAGAALEDACRVRAAFFNSGLREYVFGPGQGGGTRPRL